MVVSVPAMAGAIAPIHRTVNIMDTFVHRIMHTITIE